MEDVEYRPKKRKKRSKFVRYLRAFVRHMAELPAQTLLVIGNYKTQPQTLTLPSKIKNIVLNNLPQLKADGNEITSSREFTPKTADQDVFGIVVVSSTGIVHPDQFKSMFPADGVLFASCRCTALPSRCSFPSSSMDKTGSSAFPAIRS